MWVEPVIVTIEGSVILVRPTAFAVSKSDVR